MINARNRRFESAGIWLVVIPFILFSALLLAFIPLYAAAFVFGVGLIVAATLVPMNWLMLTILTVAAVIGGSVEYFLGMAQVNWLPFLLSVVAAFRAVASRLLASNDQSLGDGGPRGFGRTFILASAFVYTAIVLASAVINWIPFTQAFAALKNYLMMWGILVALTLSNTSIRTWRLLWYGFLSISLLQLPVVLYQRLFVASKIGNTNWGLSFDAINGTFGGGLAGGRSGAVAMFICIALAFVLATWRERRISNARCLMLIAFIVPTLFIVEVKAVAIWLPLVVMIVFGAHIRQRPGVFLGGLVAVALLVVGILLAYRYSYYQGSRESADLFDFFAHQIEYIYDPNRFNPVSRELGRVSTLVHWWREVDLANVASWLIGFGPGASRGISSLAIGELAKRYPFFIDISSASVLLWDLGVVGFAAFCSTIVVSAISSFRIARQCAPGSEEKVQLEANGIGLLLILSGVVYTRDAVDGPIMQFVMFVFLARVLVAVRSVAAMASPQSGLSAIPQRQVLA
jgi:hypothetical protein